MPFSYYVGLDLGQARDYSALALLEEPVWIPSAETEYQGWAWHLSIPQEHSGWLSPSKLTPYQLEKVLSYNYYRGRPPDPPLSLRHLERFELGTRYPAIIERVRRLLLSEPLIRNRVALLVDKTGVGASVVDSLVHAGLSPIAITIHGGSAVSGEGGGWRFRVPKRDLVSATQVLLQNGRLKIAEGLPLAETLKKELLNFRVKIDPKTAHDSYEHWREADHDDLVLATAMACWYRQWFNRHVDTANARQGVAR
jgi:hypothetical protein